MPLDLQPVEETKLDLQPVEEDSPIPLLVKRNRLGESREDLEAKAAILRNEAISNKVGDVALNTAMWGAYLTPGREQISRLMGLEQPVKERPAWVDPETLRQTVAPITQSMGLTDPITQGVTEFGAETGSALTSPSALETMATGPAAPLIFAAEMAKSSPQALEQLRQASSTGDIKETTKAALNAGLSIAGPLGIARGYSRLEKPATEVAQPKETSARSQQEASSLHANVLREPIKGVQEVPAEESGKGIPSPEKEVQEITPSEQIAKDIGITARKPIRDLWQFDVTDPKDGQPAGFSIKEGSTPEQVKAKADELRVKLVEDLGQNLTPEIVDRLSTSELQQVMGGRGHRVGIEYGEALSEKDVPDLQKKYDDSQTAMKEALKNRDIDAAQKEGAKQIFYGGALMGATEGKHPISGSNYELYKQQKSAEAAKTEPALQRPTGKGLQLKQPVAAGEAGFINIEPVKEFFDKAGKGVKAAFDFTKDVVNEVSKLPATSDYRRSVLNWSAKLQRSFGEAARIQKDVESKVKDPIRRDAITNWIQADGDPTVLRQEASGSKNARLRAGYEAALNLTPEELNIANETKRRYAALEARANRYEILKSHLDNYVNQIWDMKQGPSGSAMGRSLKEKFRFAKARTFPNFFVGEQAGYTPKTKDISKLQPIYLHEMESVIAAKELVEEMSKGVASDGRPLTAPIGAGMPVEKPAGDKATLVMPKVTKEGTKDYKVLPNQPALQDWKWAAKDDAGNNIFLKADLALHPEAYARLKNVLGKSAIRDWYQTKTTPVMEIPKKIVHGLDIANSEVKKTMLGVLSPFHQVQEATHAVGHRVNPTFNIPEIDLVRNPAQMDAARHGLMLEPDRVSENQFMEGFKQSKIISKIPAIGPASNWYSNYLFHEYIPGLKFKTYESILERNNKLYSKDLAYGKVKPEDVKILSAEQANAAFGHLNYADLGRNPTIQHIAQLGILAPDFFESRIRFAGQAVKGATGLRVGREQLLALATLAIGQAALAYVSAKLTDGEWDAKRPFEMTKNGKRYTLRSVPEDMQKFISGPRQFLHNRLSILGKGALQYSSGVDYRGRKVTAGETTKELAQQPIPLMARGFAGIGELSGMDQLLEAVGLKVSKASPRADIMERARSWGESSTNPKVKFQFEKRSKESLPDSVYKPIRQAIEADSKDAIVKGVKEIIDREPDQAAKEKRMKRLLQDFQPFTANDLKPFATPSKESEKQFVRSLDAKGKKQYRDAVKERVRDYRALTEAIYGTARNPPIPQAYQAEYGK